MVYPIGYAMNILFDSNQFLWNIPYDPIGYYINVLFNSNGYQNILYDPKKEYPIACNRIFYVIQ